MIPVRTRTRTTANPPKQQTQANKNHFAMDAAAFENTTPEKSHGYRVRIRQQIFPIICTYYYGVMVIIVVVVVVVVTILRDTFGCGTTLSTRKRAQ
jgi:hypothetical protein